MLIIIHLFFTNQSSQEKFINYTAFGRNSIYHLQKSQMLINLQKRAFDQCIRNPPNEMPKMTMGRTQRERLTADSPIKSRYGTQEASRDREDIQT